MHSSSATVLFFALIAALAGLVGILCGYAISRRRARRDTQREQPGRDHALPFRNALLRHSDQAIVILETEMTFGEGSALFRECLAGPDKSEISAVVEELQKTGASFNLAVRTAEERMIGVRGMPIGHRAVLYLQDKGAAVTKEEARLQRVIAAHCDMLERLPMAVAIFDASRRLTGHNGNYAKLWDFSEAWLDTNPSHAEILSRLRETRRLPEQRDFTAWYQNQLQLFAGDVAGSEEVWHLPGGKSLRVVTQPHLQGGMFVLFEDISEKLRLETALNLLTRVQKATLDTLDEGIAIFGTDGRLILHNAHFSELWHLTESELSRQPHFSDIAGICRARVGQDDIWSIVSAAVSDLGPEQRGKWARVRRGDGRIVSLSLSRLPNGATVVTFMDLTDLERFEAQQREVLLEQAAADAKTGRKS